ncbi:MAG: aspartyl/asparaginyl beta-hydroxylase domain-containing protein [Ginsengibacter sp.]
MIKYLQLRQLFDVGKMQADLTLLETRLWKEHYNTRHYQGSWSVLPLRSINGSMENVISIHSSSATEMRYYRDTELLERCSYLQSVLHFFECEKTSVRLMNLQAGGMIREHSDHELSFEEKEVRFHIPVVTNPEVEFFLDDEMVMMKEGECWYLNLSLRHRVKNGGTTDRVHLVIDCRVNDWIRNLFSDEGAIQKKTDHHEREKLYAKEDKLKIIAQLRLMNTPTSIELAAKIENEL